MKKKIETYQYTPERILQADDLVNQAWVSS